ncbi:hypothetical protein [Mycolicibacterium phlei]|jgi:hypothetical protein
MPGIGELALGAAPIAGGALFGLAAGNLKPPDIRGSITSDLDLLDRLPADDTVRRERLRQSINDRVDSLITASERSRAIREVATSYEGNWRDLIVFAGAVLFTIVWWYVSHDRANWLIMFVLLILLCVWSGWYAVRGIIRGVRERMGDRQAGR